MRKTVAKTRTSTRKLNRLMRERVTRYASPQSFYWMPITEGKIRQAAQRIVEAAHPESIILFGSYAYGKPTADSDVDLLVVMESDQSIHARTVELSKALTPRPFPVDIITRTPAELKDRLDIGDSFFKEIVTKGKVLHGRVPRWRVGQES
jgi:predicted nucleotidyltransferase